MVRLTYFPNTWTLPGGGVGKEEDPLTAVIRECKEEIGVNLKDPQYVDQLKFEHEHKKDTLFLYRSEIKDVQISPDGKEIAEAKWFALDALPPMGPNAQKMLALATNAKQNF
jgi:8-oxo-dGTP pyrophosphatase MutT (NUDIX family)